MGIFCLPAVLFLSIQQNSPASSSTAWNPEQTKFMYDAFHVLEKRLRTSSAICGFKISSPTNLLILFPLLKSISIVQPYLRDSALTILARISALVFSLEILNFPVMIHSSKHLRFAKHLSLHALLLAGCTIYNIHSIRGNFSFNLV